jgi:hypothetical protein
MYIQQTLNYNIQEHKTTLDIIFGRSPTSGAIACSLHREYPAIQRLAGYFYAVTSTTRTSLITQHAIDLVSRLTPISVFFLQSMGRIII